MDKSANVKVLQIYPLIFFDPDWILDQESLK
jgi:hypothetical protein